MAQIVLTVPDAVMPRVINALAAYGGYNPDTDGPRPAYAKGVVLGFVRSVVRNQEADSAAKVAHDAAATQADADIQIT